MPHTLVISSHHPQPRSLEFLTDWHDTCRRCGEVGQYNTYMVFSHLAQLSPTERLEDVLDWPKGVALYRDQTQVAFTENHGHYLGFMHALISGLRTAWRNGFGRIVALESDVLCRVEFDSVFEYMWSRDIKVMCPRTRLHNGMIESGLMFFNLAESSTFMVDDIAESMYGNYQKLAQKQIDCEAVLEQVLGDRLKTLDWPGDRDEQEQVDLPNAVYLTHAREARRRIFRALPVVRMNQETGELTNDNDNQGAGPGGSARPSGASDLLSVPTPCGPSTCHPSDIGSPEAWRDDGILA